MAVEVALALLRRELLEEISWQPPELELVMVHHIHRRTAHVFRAELSVPLAQLTLLEGLDMALVSSEELLAGLLLPTATGSGIQCSREPTQAWRRRQQRESVQPISGGGGSDQSGQGQGSPRGGE